MKITRYCLIAGLFIVAACTDNVLEVSSPDDFQVTTDSTSYKVGSPVVFRFLGTPDYISFYSGEAGNDYDFREGRISTLDSVNFSFSGDWRYGTDPNQVSVMVSSDFNGDYSDFANISAATWTDVSDRFDMPAGTPIVSAGSRNIGDLAADEKSLFVAFRYVLRDVDTYGSWTYWRLLSVTLTGFLSNDGGSSALASSVSDAGFRFVHSVPESDPLRIPCQFFSTTTIIFNRPSLTNEIRQGGSEVWAVSKGFDVGEIDFGPDWAAPIQGGITAPVEEYTYTYSKPGTYKVRFVAYNANLKDSKQVMREVDLTIVP